jgi:hypothetical protein
MRTARIIWGTLLLIICLVGAIQAASLPRTISYQGYLKDGAGAPVMAATSVVFSLYSSNPARNNPVWRESRSVTPVNGVYSVQLGSVTSITATFDVPYFLGLKVGVDAEMVLQPLGSAPYALRASVAENAGSVGGRLWPNLIPVTSIRLDRRRPHCNSRPCAGIRLVGQAGPIRRAVVPRHWLLTGRVSGSRIMETAP